MRTFLRRTAAIAAGVALVLFVFVSTTRDSTQEEIVGSEGRPRLGTTLRFQATAYCKGTTTAAGTSVRTGMAAADPALLPLGSVLQVEGSVARYDGIWTVMDTGPEVKGRELDLYMWNCNEALSFGRRNVRVTILRLGWDPQQSAPGMIEQLFRRRERARPLAPSEPPAPPVTAPPTEPVESPATEPTAAPVVPDDAPPPDTNTPDSTAPDSITPPTSPASPPPVSPPT